MRPEPQPLPGVPTEVDMERISPWHWRIVVIGDGWTTEHPYRGPRWLAKRHVRRYFHRLEHP